MALAQEVKAFLYESFHKWGLPANGWFRMDNPPQLDDLGVALFQETTIFIYI